MLETDHIAKALGVPPLTAEQKREIAMFELDPRNPWVDINDPHVWKVWAYGIAFAACILGACVAFL